VVQTLPILFLISFFSQMQSYETFFHQTLAELWEITSSVCGRRWSSISVVQATFWRKTAPTWTSILIFVLKSMIPWCHLYVSHTPQSLSLGWVCDGYANWAELETNTAYSAYSRKYFELYHWRKSHSTSLGCLQDSHPNITQVVLS